MTSAKTMLLCMAMATAGMFVATSEADAGYRQYYGGWSYYPQQQYYYTTYYYKPQPTYQGYHYHYCVHYPSQPQYVYYYNPYRKQYWGRLDLTAKDKSKAYSLLAEKDRKEKLSDIPESAFPKPGEMPAIPDTEDNLKMEAPTTMPPKEAGPEDLPKGTK